MDWHRRKYRLRGTSAALAELTDDGKPIGRETIRRFARGEIKQPDRRTKLAYTRLYWRVQFAAETIAAERPRGGEAHTLGARIRGTFGSDGERIAEAAVDELFKLARAAGELPAGAGELRSVMLDVVALSYSEEPAYVPGRVRPGRGGPRRPKDDATDE